MIARLFIVFLSTACVSLLLASVVGATDAAGRRYLEERSADPNVVTLPSGLRYMVLNKGEGSYHPAADSPCLIHYAGTLINGHTFAPPTNGRDPLTFVPNGVIEGWKEALQLMVEGDEWEIYVPSELGYGSKGSPPDIPGHSVLIFTIELLKIQGGRKIAGVNCDPFTLEGCDDTMKDFVEKSTDRFGEDRVELEGEIRRLKKMGKSGGTKEELQLWIDTRVYILERLKSGMIARDKREAVSSHCPPSDGATAASPVERGMGKSAQAFMAHLGLPRVHPLCEEGGTEEAAKSSASSVLTAAGKPGGPLDSNTLLSFINAGIVFEVPNPLNADRRKMEALQKPPPLGPMTLMELHDQSWFELLMTATTMSAPTIAMGELWLRFFAVFLCPICLCYLIHREISRLGGSGTKTVKNGKEKEKGSAKKEENRTLLVCILSMASSAVLFIDSLYVYEYGRSFGLSLLVASIVFSFRYASSIVDSQQDGTDEKNDKEQGETTKRKEAFQNFIIVFAILCNVIYLRSDGGYEMDADLVSLKDTMMKALPPSDIHAQTVDTRAKPPDSSTLLDNMRNPGIDIPTINEGVYYSPENPFVSSIIKHWPESSRTYNVSNGATPYLVNGDHRTGIPFLVNSAPEQDYVRVWVKNEFDGEYLALDIAFPVIKGEGVDDRYAHNKTKPVFLVLHGLNGGSHEEYVKDFVQRRRSEGSTIIVFIARGMMDTSIVGWNGFHGARTGDIDAAARVIRKGLSSLAKNDKAQILVGVGYSMGAIILSNYVARTGQHCALDAAMAVSGGLDMRQQLNFKRSMRLWQPMLTFGLREDNIIGKYARHYKHRLTDEQFRNLLRVTSISALDVEAIVAYNSFDGLYHYYSEMSAMGDRDPEFQLLGSNGTVNEGSEDWGRIANVAIPFAVLQALDDPLVGWRTVGTNNPQRMVDSGRGNLLLVLTKAGGHVGWPLGNNPKSSSWKWMNDAARDFALAVDMAREEIGGPP